MGSYSLDRTTCIKTFIDEFCTVKSIFCIKYHIVSITKPCRLRYIQQSNCRLANGIALGQVSARAISDGAIAPGVVGVFRHSGAVFGIQRNDITLQVALVIVPDERAVIQLVHHAHHAGMVIQVDKFPVVHMAADVTLRAALPDQTAKVVILIGGLVTVGVIAVRSGVGIVGITLLHTLAVGIVGKAAILIQRTTLRGVATPNSRQLILAPGVGLAIVGSGTAQYIIANRRVITYILPLFPPAVKKKPPGPQWPGWPHP